MKNITIISHLTVLEWKESWKGKVIEDTQENMKKNQLYDGYWGHFTGDSDFILCYHRGGEIRGMSLSQYFTGHIEKDEKGSKITGSFGKKRSANLFLGMGAVLCILAIIGSLAYNEVETLAVAAILLVILFIVYFLKPKGGQQTIMKKLEEISFDDSFHNIKISEPKKKKKKKTMKDKAMAASQPEVVEDKEETAEK